MISDSDDTLATLAKIIGVIGRADPKTAAIAVSDLIAISRHTVESLPILLKEIEGVAECFPTAVLPHLGYIRSLPKTRPLTTAVCDRIRAFCSSEGRFRQGYLYGPTSEEVTVVSVLNATGHSDDSLISRVSSKVEAPVISSGVRTTVNISDSAEFSAQELDKNTENLANVYSRLRSSCSLTNQTSRSYGSLNPYNENVSAETASRDSPVVPSQANRRCNGVPFVPIYPPPSYHSPKGHTFPQTVLPAAVQMGKDGRVRPMIIHTRRNASHWFPSSSNPPPYETTFPVNPNPITAKISPKVGNMSHTVHEEVTPRNEKLVTAMEREQNNELNERGDVVKQFVNHRRSNIQNFVNNFTKIYPIPVQCTVEGTKDSGSKHRMRVHFRCQVCDLHCIYNAEQMFSFKTRVAPIWLHLMFLQMEATSIETTGEVIAQSSETYQTLSSCWRCLPSTVTHNRPFSELVTSAFPAQKEQQQIKKELCEANYFESFSYSAQLKKWSCFSCSHPERVRSILQPDSPHLPVLEGQLKEKRGRWKFLKRWHTKYFTLSSATLSCREESADPATDQIISPSIELRKIRSVKSLTKGRKSRKSLPKAFEIFTEDDVSYVLKANDQSKAEEWIQWLQIAVAQAHKER